ncbi:hypothetical protein BU26DRAFT_350203 [Trematosphaeria pertusa]|uniref:Uncharacterized protein n=1 Tax=Trematosphaeria pertusa TaxID=390896 RepID=A0A6A6IDF1_9PLEO|nr:uncharacterized protein BU26DRAFT_350203 [Trematosphaeria pertusa]KAF2247590.1 hypothetical protein BU26DRAFT_350203 [Trematosphaeria pertusa]
MSSSPASKRNLKPSPLAANPPQSSPFAASSDLPALQPATTSGQEPFANAPQPPTPGNARKRKSVSLQQQEHMASTATSAGAPAGGATATASAAEVEPPAQEPKAKKSRTNTPWTPAEEQRLKQMRDAGNSWSEIAKTFPQRTEGSVKKHWYKDMHYAEFGEDESAALLAAIKEYEQNKWKVIGQKVGKPAKACEQYAKEHFGGKY